MKALFVFTLSIFLLVSCQKDLNSEGFNSQYLENVENCLKDSIRTTDYSELDFKKAIITNPDSSFLYLRIPFKSSKFSNKFVLLKTNQTGKTITGFIIEIQKDTSIKELSIYNGFIKVDYLNGTAKFKSEISNGYISIFHANMQAARSLVVPSDNSHVLPEVVVTCYARSAFDVGGYNNWVNISCFFDDASGATGVYSSLDIGRGDGAGGGSNGGENKSGYNYQSGGGLNNVKKPYYQGLTQDENIQIDFEAGENLSPIDIVKYLKCFSTIPDAGSKCSIELFTDIPVDDHPEKLLNWQTGSPGHTFLQIKKELGSQSIVQNIGFYPAQGWKSILANSPVASKFVDNSNHEYNAGIRMDLSPDKFNNTLTHMQDISTNLKYDIDDYNCTDFALDIFNYTRGASVIQIPRYYVPGSVNFSGSNTPQGLYNKLVDMQRSNVEKSNITIPGIKQWVNASNGPCN